MPPEVSVMPSNVRYVLVGAVVMVFILAGAWFTWSLPSRVVVQPVEVAPAAEGVPLRSPPVVESASADSANATQPVTPDEPPVEPPAAQIGTVENPLTDMDVILDRVAEFARRQEETLLGREGWLHVAQAMSSPKPPEGDYYSRATDEMIPVASLVPQNPTFETWYRVNEAGAYIEGMSLVTDPTGNIHQQTLLIDGNWLNLTLRGPDAYRRKQYNNSVWVNEPFLTSVVAFNALEKERDWPNVTWHAYSADGQFILVSEQRYDSPVRLDDFPKEAAVGARTVYAFDEAGGRLLSQEHLYLLESGAMLPGEALFSLTEAFMEELPAGTLRLFDEAVYQVAENR